MRNGINKFFLTSLFVILGLCFNSNYTYGVTARLDCARDPGNASRMVDCYDIAIGETIEYTDVDSTIGNGFKFSNTIINDAPVFVSTMAWTDYIAYTTTFFIGTGYGTVDFQDWGTNYENHAQYNYIRTGSYAYCTGTTDQWNTCYQRNFTKTYEQAQERVEGLTLSGYTFVIQNRLNEGFYTNKHTYQICATYVDSDRYLCINVPHENGNAGGQCASNNQCNYYTTTKTTAGIDASFIASLGPTISPFYVEENTTPQNNYYTCPTIQQLIDTYPSQYNTGLCYSSNLIFSNGTIETITPKSIFELYPYLTGFMRDIDLYNNYCTAPNTTTTCQTAFEGKEIEYTLISKAMDTNINKMKLYQYCNLQLNFEDKNATTCVSTGIYATGVQENITTQDIANALLNEDYQTILPATTGTVFEDLQGDGRQVNWNILESIENIYTKITSIFQGRSGTNGIIPEYITRMILVICLFALFKK